MTFTDPATTPVKDYINSTLTQIQEGLPKDARIEGAIKITMTTVVQKEAKGGISIKILDLGAKASENQTQKIEMSVRFPSESEKIEEEISKIKAQANKELEKSARAMIKNSTRRQKS